MTMDENEIYPPTGTHSTEDVVERVKARLQQEGREARNLIAYSLLLQEHKPRNIKQGSCPKREKKLSLGSPQQKQDKRQRSASAGRDPQTCLRARHWGFLFRNLQLAVDEIYQTCEDDESTVECKEAILMLERYTNDFYKLIEWLKLKWEFENTAPPERPMSVTWEIRTSSPGKIPPAEKRNYHLMDAKRVLNFNSMYGSKFTKPETSMKMPPCKHGLLNSKSINPIISIQEVKSDRDSSTESIKNNKSSEIVCDSGVLSKSTGEIKGEGESSSKPCHVPSLVENKKDVPNAIDDCNSDVICSRNSNNILKELIPVADDESSKLQVVKKLDISDVKASEEVSTEMVKSTTQFDVKAEKNVESTKDEEISQNVSYGNTLGTKQSSATRRSPRSTPVSVLSDEAKVSEHDNVKKVAVEGSQNRNATKAVPTVNMNKASQVRKAFNQSKTPNKIVRNPQWKIAGALQSEPKQTKPNLINRGSQKRTVESKESKVSYSSRAKSSIHDKIGGPVKSLLTRSATTLSDAHVQRKQRCESESLSNNSPSTSSLSSIATTSSGLSWADKVKGTRSEVSSVSLQDDDEGWEVIRRGRRSNTGSAASLNSHAGKAKLRDVDNKHRTSLEGSVSKKEKQFLMKDRFNQPSAAASMPSLFIDKPNVDCNSENVHDKIRRHNTLDGSNSVSTKETPSVESRPATIKKNSTCQNSTISAKAKAVTKDEKHKKSLKPKTSNSKVTEEIKLSKSKSEESIVKRKGEDNVKKGGFCVNIMEVDTSTITSTVSEVEKEVANAGSNMDVVQSKLNRKSKSGALKRRSSKDSETLLNGLEEKSLNVDVVCSSEKNEKIQNGELDGNTESCLKSESEVSREWNENVEKQNILNSADAEMSSKDAKSTNDEMVS